MVFLPKYHELTSQLISTESRQDGKLIKRYKHKVETVNGQFRREQFQDGYFVIYFENGDIRQTYPD
jgi:hypothetical protein